MSDELPGTIGVIGAGTMGAGIAQLASQTGARTLLHDPIPEALERGMETLASGLARLVARGRLNEADSAAIRDRVEPVGELAALQPCGIVIEAAPERLELKRKLFGALAEIVGPECVLATNTSSLSVTEIAGPLPHPERVVGLHFFNPAPVMKLAEVVAGQASGEAALAVARAVGEAMGKHVIDARDIAGFLVNRCNRPFSLEALRLLQERVATVEQIDRIARLGGGFRMGPFELMDLIGIDTNHAVAETFHRASYGEPRYQPSALQARMVASGRLGRKTGAGWYDYAEGAERPADPEPPSVGGGEGRSVLIFGWPPITAVLREAAARAGWEVRADPGRRPLSLATGPQHREAAPKSPWLVVDCDGLRSGGRYGTEPYPGRETPRARLLHDSSLALSEPSAAGFHLLGPLDGCRLAEVTSTPSTLPEALERTETFLATLGLRAERVGDAPGLVLGRIVAQLVNEAAFLVGEGNGSAEDVEAGLRLGVNHPRGPVGWTRLVGLGHVVAILDALHGERGEPRYRVAPLLRRLHALGADALDDALV